MSNKYSQELYQEMQLEENNIHYQEDIDSEMFDNYMADYL